MKEKLKTIITSNKYDGTTPPARARILSRSNTPHYRNRAVAGDVIRLSKQLNICVFDTCKLNK